ncbi:receptor superfamily member 6b [Pristimantis euphronides]
MTRCNKMYYSSRVQVLVSLVLVSIAMADEFTSTYEWTDETGKSVTCQKCPPGTYVATHCSSTTTTVCQVCPTEHYTQYWNYLEKCRFCNVICQEGEQVQNECSSTHNRVCECQTGYHRRGQYCVKDLECNFQEVIQGKGDENCDNLVIDYIVSLNLTATTYHRLESDIITHIGKKNSSHRRVRKLLKDFMESNPDDPLLPHLLQLVKKAKLHKLGKKLRQRFLQPEQP